MSDSNMCDHSYYLAPNTLPDTEGTYHGVYVSNGTDTLDDVCKNIETDKANVKKGTSKIVIRSMFGKLAEIISTRLCRVSAGPVTFEAAISGTVPYANSALGSDNEVYIAVRLSDQLRNAAAGITPKYVRPGAVAAVFDGVEDTASGQKSCISGTAPFVGTGLRLSATNEGERIEVVDKDGVSHEATVVSEDHGQRITARLPSALPAGKGRVVISTRGYKTPEGDVHTYSRSVTILAAEPGPTPEPLDLTEVQTAGEPVGSVNETALTVLRGVSLPTWDGSRDLCEVRYDGQSFACHDIEQDPDGYLEFTIDTTAGEVMNDGNQCVIYARINGREGSINAEWKH